MVPDGLVNVTVENLRSRLEATEARAVRRGGNALGELSEERSQELSCHDMYYACSVTLQNWARELALALDDGCIADYAQKAAQLKDDHNRGLGRILDVRTAVAMVAVRIRNNRRGLLFDERSRSEIRNHTLPMRGGRKRVHRTAVTSSHLMTWGY